MKKYQQLILVVLSLLSLISLLFYRHEYNKLRYVLEVLNFFGTPGASPSAASTTACFQNSTVEKLYLSEPLPAWQRVSNTLYIYSAYWETVNDKGHVKAIAIGVLNENLNYGCYVWFDKYSDPIKGQFSFSGIARKNQKVLSKNSISSKYFGTTTKTKGFMFYCDPGVEKYVPFGVTFYKTNNDDTSQAFLPVVNVNVNLPPVNVTAACVMPVDQLILKKSQYLEFLAFHKVIGINNFILYGGAYQHNVLAPILKNPMFDVDLTVLHWNYPFVGDFDLMQVVAEADCVLRTRGYFENVILLSWNQFLVPKYHSNVNNIITDLDSDKKTFRFQLSTSLFCLEYKDDPKSDANLPLVFRKTRFAYPKVDTPVSVVRPHLTEGVTQKISKDVAVIQWYTKCDMFDLKPPDKTMTTKYDHSILKFNTEFMQSKIRKIATVS